MLNPSLSRRRGLALLWLAFALATPACRGDSPHRCVPGASAPCACPDGTGRTSAQTCGAEGTFGACACAQPPSTQTPSAEKPPQPAVDTSTLSDSPPVAARPRGVATPAARATPPSAAPPSPLPETPDRDTVGVSLRSLSDAVRPCGMGAGGTAMVTIVFASTGRVLTSNVNGIPNGPAVACIVGVVRHATLPPFSRPTFSVTYPYPLN